MTIVENTSKSQKYSSHLNLYTDNIRFKDLIKDLVKEKKETFSENYNILTSSSSIAEMNTHLKTKDFSKAELDIIKHLLIKNMTYTSLRTVYLDKLTKEFDLQTFERDFSKVKDEYVNKFSITNQDIAKKSLYYNLLWEVNIDKFKKVFIPAIYKKEKKITFFLAYKYYDEPSEQEKVVIATCIIFLDTGAVETHVKNDFMNAKASEVKISSTEKFYYEIKEILKKIGFILQERKTAEEKKKLFEYCKDMNRKMLEDYESEVSAKIVTSLSPNINSLIKELKSEISLDSDDEDRITKKIESICVSEYVTKKISSLDLRKKALEKGLKGYPTKIKYKNKDSANSQTSSKGKGEPLPVHEIFHSINTVFEDMSILSEIRIAWFEKYTFASEKSYENKTSVNQTTIKGSKKYFKINFSSTSKVNEEMVEFVISEIRRIL